MRRAAPRPAASSSPSPLERKRRRDIARRMVDRLRRRRQYRRDLRQRRIARGLRTPQKRRKLALALGASAVGLNVPAVSAGAVGEPVAVIQMIAEDPREVRVDAAKISVSDEMKMALIEEEGVHYRVYADPVGYLTVGVGHLVTPQDNLRLGQRISDEQMLEFLEQDLEKAEQAIQRLVGDLRLYQHEFDALVDLAFNVGEGNVSPEKSPRLNKAIANGDYEAIADQLAYHNAAGERLKGLQIRSDRREAIFMEARYDNPRTADTVRG